ncbi:MAG TPA: hypothetical protein VJA66_03875, partial [Thermoanaerobaculia bacterium]
VTAQNCSTAGMQAVSIDPTSCPQPQGFFTVPPCRLLDTRLPADGPALAANVDRTYMIVGRCGIPASATALSLNVTVTQPTQAGSVTVRPGNTPFLAVPYVSYSAGQTRANNAIIALGAAGDYTATCNQPSGTTQLILDVNGYFQ